MPWISPTVAVVDRVGRLLCLRHETPDAEVEARWTADNSQLLDHDNRECDGCGAPMAALYDRKLKARE